MNMQKFDSKVIPGEFEGYSRNSPIYMFQISIESVEDPRADYFIMNKYKRSITLDAFVSKKRTIESCTCTTLKAFHTQINHCLMELSK